jgi:hypothetical protein
MDKKYILAFLFFIPLFFTNNLYSQTSDATLTVFLDCRNCSETFIRSEIDFVNFVRDQSVAEVQLLITAQRTGSGGRQFTLEFFGLAGFTGIDNKMLFISPQDDTEEMRRNRLVKYIKLGLINYLSNKDVIDQLEVKYTQGEKTESVQSDRDDPWKGWNFNLGLSYNFSGEQRQGENETETSFRAQQITELWKIRVEYEYSYNNRFFIRENSQGQDSTANFVRTEQRLAGLIGRSLSDHWTVGAYLNGESSTQRNFDLRAGFAPTIEYSLFPYSEFVRREITFRYGILAEQNDYTDQTIFRKDYEFLFRQNLNMTANFTQPWGSIFGRIEAGAYMHDFSKNSLQLRLRINMRVSRAISFNVSGRYERINDQLSFPAQGLSEEEILLNLRDQSTNFRYGGFFGIDFNFGSLYNNIVNPRL